MKIKSRAEVPRYAEFNSIQLTKSQFASIFKRGYKSHPTYQSSGPVRIAQTKDGKYWAEQRGEYVFWAHRWYEIPKIVGDRAKEIDEFVKSF